LAVETTGGDEMIVRVNAWEVGAALEAADDPALLNPPSHFEGTSPFSDWRVQPW
jgi:hypothetical protein